MLLFFTLIHCLFCLLLVFFSRALPENSIGVYGDVCCLFCVKYPLTETIYFVLFLLFDITYSPPGTKPSYKTTAEQRREQTTNTITMHLFIVSPAAPFICICRLCSDNRQYVCTLCTHCTIRMAVFEHDSGHTKTHRRKKKQIATYWK